jgi:ribosome biogenesis GTPase
LCQDLPEKIRQIQAVAADTPIFTVSGTTGLGVEALRDYLKSGVTYALVGSSGVGKSTLLNALLGAELQKTATVRESDSRGRHTTTHRELVKLPGGALLIDSPGIREIQLWHGEVGLEDAFQDITDLEAACHFADCTHTQETGCAVQAALADGSLSQARYKNYLKLNREIHYLEQKQSQVALLEAKRKVKELHRNIKLYHKNFDIKR